MTLHMSTSMCAPISSMGPGLLHSDCPSLFAEPTPFAGRPKNLVMASIVMAYIVMACIVMGYGLYSYGRQVPMCSFVVDEAPFLPIVPPVSTLPFPNVGGRLALSLSQFS